MILFQNYLPCLLHVLHSSNAHLDLTLADSLGLLMALSHCPLLDREWIEGHDSLLPLIS
jgi:hypothetical protein